MISHANAKHLSMFSFFLNIDCHYVHGMHATLSNLFRSFTYPSITGKEKTGQSTLAFDAVTLLRIDPLARPLVKPRLLQFFVAHLV